MPHYNYLYQTRDIKFQIKEWLDSEKLLGCDGYKDYYGVDDFDAICDVNFKICKDVMCPANKESDEVGMKHVGGNEKAVISPDSFKTVYNTICDAGLGPQFGDRQVEGRIPLYWYAPILEMQSGASPAIVMLWCLTQGATTILQYNLQENLQPVFLPKMYSGEWGGSMCMTEPNAGSDVGAVTTRCIPTDDPEIWKVKGQKCFITTGDWDGVPNIIHLVLAKGPDAKAGTAGINCLVVPKFWVDREGNVGAWNDVTTVNIEHKMGLHGSATCTLAFGENDNCYGYMIGSGPVDGRGVGMRQMFQMMNEERINTGIFALGAFTSAYYAALDYTKIRVQSAHRTNPKGPSVRVIEHEDVRRMLLLQKSVVEASRALLYLSYWYIDYSKEAPTEELRQWADDMFMIQNPLCKAWISDMAWLMTAEAILCHGGYGFMEEYAPASLARDCKIYGIWEGTNFMHAQDFTGRKYQMNKGEPFKLWVKDIGDFIAEKKTDAFKAEFDMLEKAFAAFNSIMAQNGEWRANDPGRAQMFATRVLHTASRMICGKLMADQALLAAKKLAELGDDHFDAPFYKSKIATARFFILNVVPEIFGYEAAIKAADYTAAEIPEEALM